MGSRIIRTSNIEEDERFEVTLNSSFYGNNKDDARDREVNNAIFRLKYDEFAKQNRTAVERVLKYIREHPSCHQLVTMPHNSKLADRILEDMFDKYGNK